MFQWTQMMIAAIDGITQNLKQAKKLPRAFVFFLCTFRRITVLSSNSCQIPTSRVVTMVQGTSVLHRFWSGVTIEPVIACYMTAFTLITLTVSNLNLQKACKVNLRLAGDTCEALVTKNSDGYESDEIAVQQLVAAMMMWQTCAQNVLPCLLMLLVGSWSDRTRKRVPCMLLPLYGELVRNMGQMLCVYYFYELPMEAAGVVETIPLALTGGQTMFTMTAYSYIGDATSAKQRTFRIGGINAIMAISMAVGTSLSGIVYNQLGFYGAYGISSVLIIIGLLYGLLYVKDIAPVTEVEKNKSYRMTVSEFFDLRHITQSLTTTFKKRRNTRRLEIIILLIILMTNAGTNSGYRTVSYLYTRVRFNWNEVKYSIYATYELSINIIGLLFSIFVLSKLLKISDEIIGMLSTISQMLAALFYTFTYNEFLFFVGPLLNIIVAAENVSIKSLMTKLVPNTELSQIAAIFGIAEIIVSLVFGLMYNGLYQATLDTLPSAFYILTIVFSAPSIVLFLWMYKKRNHEREHSNSLIIYEETSQPNKKSIGRSNYGTIVK